MPIKSNKILEINFRKFIEESYSFRYLEFRNERNYYYVRLDSLITISRKILKRNEDNPDRLFDVYYKDVTLCIMRKRAIEYRDFYYDTVTHKCMSIGLTEHMLKFIQSSCTNEEDYLKNKKHVDSFFSNIVNSYKIYRHKNIQYHEKIV